MALRLALLGCGSRGRQYVDIVATGGSTVLVVFDSDPQAATAMMEQTGGRLAPSLSDAVTAVGVDAIVVCLDGEDRITAIDAAAAAGRPVFDASPPLVDVMPALHRAHAACVVGMDFRRRHDAGVREIIDAVRGDQIGGVSSCSIVDRDGSLRFEDALLHDLDLARHLTGSDIDSVAAVGNDQSVMVVLTHSDGVITSIETSQHAPAGDELRIEVAGAAGTVSTGTSLGVGATIATADGQWRTRQHTDAVERSLTEQWASFVDDVRRSAATEVVADADAALVAVSAVTRSLAEGRRVEVAELLSAP